MKYFFILGNNPALSMAEISTYLGLSPDMVLFSDARVLLVEIERKLRADEINNWGGIIKFGSVIEDAEEISASTIIENYAIREGKNYFGFSNYSYTKVDDNKLAMEVKKILKEKGASSRWVQSKEKTLSSVVVSENHLLDKGAEFCFFGNDKNVYIGISMAVQPFKDLSARDYGRPSRDDYSGMIPPKLAMIMLNIAGAKKTDKILDPFCGSGTVVNEAIMSGYKNVYGSDISKKAIRDSEDNFNWLKKKNSDIVSPKLQIMNVASLSKQFSEKTFHAIVTEPYLGPQRGKKDVEVIINELNHLYSDAIAEFLKVLKDDGRVVMVWPCLMDGRKMAKLGPEIKGFKIVNVLEQFDIKFKEMTERGTIIYGRPGQRVWREIVVLEKKLE